MDFRISGKKSVYCFSGLVVRKNDPPRSESVWVYFENHHRKIKCKGAVPFGQAGVGRAHPALSLSVISAPCRSHSAERSYKPLPSRRANTERVGAHRHGHEDALSPSLQPCQQDQLGTNIKHSDLTPVIPSAGSRAVRQFRAFLALAVASRLMLISSSSP